MQLECLYVEIIKNLAPSPNFRPEAKSKIDMVLYPSIAAFLSREEARYITGEIIRVDGGMAI